MYATQMSVIRPFPFNRSVDVPKTIVKYRWRDKALLVAPTQASYIVVGPVAEEFVTMFRGGVALGAALASLRAKYTGDSSTDIDSVLENLLRQIEMHGFYERAEPQEDTPSLSVLMRVTNRCNLQCVHCLMSASPTWRTEQELCFATWCRIIDEYANFMAQWPDRKRRLTVTGGEPLLREDALAIARHAKTLGLYTELYTNAALISTRECASLVAGAVDEVQISVDGATAPIHDAIRGQGMFDRTVHAIRLLRAENVKVRLAIVVMPINYDDLLANLAPFVCSLGDGYSIRLGLAVEQGRADQRMLFSSVAQGEERMRALIARLVDARLRAPNAITPNLKLTSCGYAHEVTISSDGAIYACGPEKFPIGNGATDSFAKIAERMASMAECTEIDAVEGCRTCDIRYLCGGTCRLNNIARTGRSNVSCCDAAERDRRICALAERAFDTAPLRRLAQINGVTSTAVTPASLNGA